MQVKRILIGSAAFGLSFGLSFLAERNLQRSLRVLSRYALSVADPALFVV
jgi:hypothetical protein